MIDSINNPHCENMSSSLSNFLLCQKEIEELLTEYGSVLAPRIVEYEVEQCEFPVEVLNEIRAIYAHLYRASVSSSRDDIVGNVEKAKSHSKRAVLDCYKYLCVTYDTRYHEFFKKFDYINWSKSNLISDVQSIDNKRTEVVKILRQAKIRESTEKASGNASSSEDYRKLYQEAHIGYTQLMDMLATLEEKITNEQTIISRFPARLVAFASVLGLLLGFFLRNFFF